MNDDSDEDQDDMVKRNFCVFGGFASRHLFPVLKTVLPRTSMW
jgi:hypothetical protein